MLEWLHESGTAGRWWAATAAVALLESPDAGGYDEDALRTWRMRFKQAEAAEERAWAEITGTPFFSQIARHDLSEFELDQLRADLARCLPVSRLAGAQESSRFRRTTGLASCFSSFQGWPTRSVGGFAVS